MNIHRYHRQKRLAAKIIQMHLIKHLHLVKHLHLREVKVIHICICGD